MNLVYAEYKEARGALIKIRIANQATDERDQRGGGASEERGPAANTVPPNTVRRGRCKNPGENYTGPGKQNEFLR